MRPTKRRPEPEEFIPPLGGTGFKEKWGISKDHISVCRDCEFRYACSDCRAYLENPEDAFSKPLKCGYDPYSGKWNEWSENPAKRMAAKLYGIELLMRRPAD